MSKLNQLVSHFLAAFSMLDDRSQFRWLDIITEKKNLVEWLKSLNDLPVDAVALILQHEVDHEREKSRKVRNAVTREFQPAPGNKAGVPSAS